MRARGRDGQIAGHCGAPPVTPALSERLRLIVITDVELAQPRTVIDVVREAVGAGAPAIQLRDKAASARELAEMGRIIRGITREAGALFFVNDRVDVALAVDADGVHLGPDDIPISAVKRSVRDGFLIGASTDDPAVAHRLVEEGASYLGCGTVFETTTKADAGSAIGLAGLQRVVEAVQVPVVGIGGITAEGAAEIAEGTGAAGTAVVSAIMRSASVETEVRRFMAPWRGGS